jgi:metal-responsive CopG/Arc/MetJ family transcriptional regulator
MANHTIEVTEIPDELLELLDERARQQGGDRASVVRELLRKELQLGAISTAEDTRPHSSLTFGEILAPVHRQAAQNQMTDDELERLFEETREQVREEKRSAQSQ